MTRLPLLLFLLALLSGCRQLLVLGDSNSCALMGGCTGEDEWWPEHLTLPWGTTLTNASRPGMTAGEYRTCGGHGTVCQQDSDCPATCDAELLIDNLPASGAWRLAQLLESHRWRSTTLVLALGTNDLLPGATAVPGLVLALVDQALKAHWTVYVAALPPRKGIDALTLVGVNGIIREGMRSRGLGDHVLPFDEVEPGDLAGDGVHATAAGQLHRAAQAKAVLFP